MKNFLNLFIKKKKNFKIQSFTFYIPSPPDRATGYREKQFDKIFYNFINQGYKILHFTTQQSISENQSGMWLIFILEATNEDSNDLKLEEFFNESLIKQNNKEDQIEGLYYIKDNEIE